jgi:hypothetical protein
MPFERLNFEHPFRIDISHFKYFLGPSFNLNMIRAVYSKMARPGWMRKNFKQLLNHALGQRLA